MVDTKKLATLDTGVLLRWLKLEADEEGVCAAAVDALQKDEHRLAIPSPAFAELRRCHDAGVLFPLRGLQVLSFDRQAADLLGTHFPHGRIAQLADPGRLSHLKFDVQIVACALRHHVTVHVALDEDHHKLCDRAGLRCVWPKQLVMASQVPIDFS
jgi:hypothetical protein